MHLKQLLHEIICIETKQDRKITGLASDSRLVKPGDLFLAYPGTQTDGRRYLLHAIQNGAEAILMEQDATCLPIITITAVPAIMLTALKARVSEIASRFYGYPSRGMTLIGITGTNGKSSCTHFLANCLAKLGKPCGLIGSVFYGFYPSTGNAVKYPVLKHSHLTTPDPITLQRVLAHFRECGIRYVALEISSHALDQQRLNGLFFHVVCFTNLTHDHLDYHHSFEQYAATKQMLFTHIRWQHAIFNQDDTYGERWAEMFAQKSPSSVHKYTVRTQLPKKLRPTVYAAEIIQSSYTGISARIFTPKARGILTNPYLIGQINISNLTLVLAILDLLNQPLAKSLQVIKSLRPVKGRLEKLKQGYGEPLIIIDYAHTPDALQKSLTSIQNPNGKVWCIFGCGGNRDASKRSLMGIIAEKYADRVIVTQDNSRGEPSESIVQSIISELQHPKAVDIILDRQQAIAQTIFQSNPHDIVLIAGKGHETTQVIQNQSYPFSDHQAAYDALKAKSQRYLAGKAYLPITGSNSSTIPKLPKKKDCPIGD